MSGTTKRTLSVAAVLTGAALALTACANPTPPAEGVAGQPLTWAQQHELAMQRYQADHDSRRQDLGNLAVCKLKNCV